MDVTARSPGSRTLAGMSEKLDGRPQQTPEQVHDHYTSLVNVLVAAGREHEIPAVAEQFETDLRDAQRELGPFAA